MQSVDNGERRSIIQVAFWVTLLSALAWPAQFVLVLLIGGSAALFRNFASIALGVAVSVAFGISAWLLSQRRLAGAALASILYFCGVGTELLSGHGHLRPGEIVTLSALGISLLALRALVPKARASSAAGER